MRRLLEVRHAEPIDLTFNPAGGRGIAQFVFRIVYTVPEESLQDAAAAVVAHWDEVRSACLCRLMQFTRADLASAEGLPRIEAALVDALAPVFRATPGRPRVGGVVWDKVLLQ